MLFAIWGRRWLGAHTVHDEGCGSSQEHFEFRATASLEHLTRKNEFPFPKTGKDAFINAAKDDFKAIYQRGCGHVEWCVMMPCPTATSACIRVTAGQYGLQSATVKCATLTGSALESCMNTALCDLTNPGLPLSNGRCRLPSSPLR